MLISFASTCRLIANEKFEKSKLSAHAKLVEAYTTSPAGAVGNHALARAGCAVLSSLGLSANGHSGATGLTSTVAP